MWKNNQENDDMGLFFLNMGFFQIYGVFPKYIGVFPNIVFLNMGFFPNILKIGIPNIIYVSWYM